MDCADASGFGPNEFSSKAHLGPTYVTKNEEVEMYICKGHIYGIVGFVGMLETSLPCTNADSS